MIFFCSSLFPRCSPHHSNTGWVGGVQLPRGVPWGTPRAVRVTVGEEGRRYGKISSLSSLLSYGGGLTLRIRSCFEARWAKGLLLAELLIGVLLAKKVGFNSYILKMAIHNFVVITKVVFVGLTSIMCKELRTYWVCVR